MDIQQLFADFLSKEGIDVPPSAIMADGLFHRLHKPGRPEGTKDIAYVLYNCARPAGYFKDHHSGNVKKWRPAGAPLTAEERDAVREAAEAAKRAIEEGHDRAAIECQGIWETAIQVAAMPIMPYYLVLKEVLPHGTRSVWMEKFGTKASAIVIPLMDEDNKIWSLQYIWGAGHKAFHPGGRKHGLYYTLPISPKADMESSVIHIAEGFATAATVYEMAWEMTIVAFDCGNLLPVGQAIRRKYPTAHIVFEADNDRHTPGNPGLTKAQEAAEAIDGYINFPSFPDGVTGTDWNDWRQYVDGGGKYAY